MPVHVLSMACRWGRRRDNQGRELEYFARRAGTSSVDSLVERFTLLPESCAPGAQGVLHSFTILLEPELKPGLA